MEIKKASSVVDPNLKRRIDALFLCQAISASDEGQYKTVLEHSTVQWFDPGEIVLKAGEHDRWLYFLLRGSLKVVSDPEAKTVISMLTAGEVFGDLALLTGKPRGLYVKVPDNARQATVLAIDFGIIGNLEGTPDISVDTQILTYRQLVHILRWRNDQYRMRFPANALAKAPYETVIIEGEPGSKEELQTLARQANLLAERLIQLNQELGALPASNRVPEHSTA